MKRLLARRRSPDGIFSNDEMAVGAMRAIKEAGRAIPAEVAVFGFDNLVLSEIVEPHLSTVKVDYELMARTAVRILIDNLSKGKFIPQSVTIPVELRIRETTAKVLASRIGAS